MKAIVAIAVLFAATTCQAGWLFGPNVRVEHHYYGQSSAAVYVPAYAAPVLVSTPVATTRVKVRHVHKHIHVHGRKANVTIIQGN